MTQNVTTIYDSLHDVIHHKLHDGRKLLKETRLKTETQTDYTDYIPLLQAKI